MLFEGTYKMKYTLRKDSVKGVHIVKYSVTDGNKGGEAGRIIPDSKEERGGSKQG